MKALLLAPMGSVHRRFNTVNIEVLQRLGYEVHLAANFNHAEGAENKNEAFALECKNRGITIHSIPFQRHSLSGNLAYISDVKKLLNEGFALVHAHTETGGLILRLAGLGTKNGRYYFTPHGMSFYIGSALKTQMIYRPIERWICSGMDGIFAINREEYHVLKAWNKDTAKYVHGIGLDFERIRTVNKDRNTLRLELNIPEAATVLLSVGELDDNKNHEVVLKAMSKLRKADVYYVICGIGAHKGRLRQIAGELGVRERLLLLGYRNDIPDLISASDIFAFPSYHEGLPVALMEAMAGGLPVVCSNIRGNVDLVRDGRNGFLVAPADINGWEQALGRMIEDKTLRDTFVSASRKVIGRYSLEYVEKELDRYYRQ